MKQMEVKRVELWDDSEGHTFGFFIDKGVADSEIEEAHPNCHITVETLTVFGSLTEVAAAAAKAAKDAPWIAGKLKYVAAWPDAASVAMLKECGVEKCVHLTTFFDAYGQMDAVIQYPWSVPKTAQVAAVEPWTTDSGTYIVAELTDCGWSQVINDHYLAQGVRQDLPHKPHVTLCKQCPPDLLASLRERLVGKLICFDRHGADLRFSNN